MTPEERKRDWEKRQRQRDWAARQAQPAPQPPKDESYYQWARRNLGLEGRKFMRNVADAATSGAEIVTSALSGDSRPLRETVELGARQVGQLFMAGAPAVGLPIPVQSTITNQSAMERVNERRAARREAGPDAQYWRRSREDLARYAAQEAADPALSSRALRFGLGALPYVGLGVATGGSVPLSAGLGAAMELNTPENLAIGAALGAIPGGGARAARSAAAPAKFVAPILRRIRGGGSAVTETAEAVAGRAVRQAPLESYRFTQGEGPLLLEAAPPKPFGVRLGKERAPKPGATGPRVDEAVALELRKQADPSLVTKTERTPLLEIISAARKAGLLSSVKTHLRNVGGTGLFQLSEEAARMPGAVVDILLSGATKRRMFTGPSLDSMRRSFHEAATKGWKEAKEVWRKGVTQADVERLGLNQEVNSGSKILDTYINRTFRLLSAEDKLAHTYAARRALEGRAKALALTEMHAGKITRGQVGERTMEILKRPPEDLGAAAAADAEIAVFTNDNLVSKFLAAGGREVEKLPGGRGATFGVDMVFPFPKTPTNVIARMLDYAGYGAAKETTKAIARRIVGKSMTPAQQFAFSQAWGRAGIGGGLIALGYIGHRDGWLTGFIEDDLNRRARDEAAGRIPGAIRIGDTWHQIIGAAPLASLLIVGATLAREVGQEREGSGLLPTLETFGQAIGEAPLLIGSKQVAESLTKPGTTGERLLGGLVGSFVPTGVSDVAEALDPAQRETRGAGITGLAQKRIPGLRQTLPQAQDVLGVPRQDYNAVQALIDPTRATTDIARRNPTLAELTRLDLGLSGLRQKQDENAAEFRARIQEFGRLYLNYGAALVSDPQYRVSDDAVKREVLRSLNRVIKQQLGDDDEGVKPGKFTAPALLESLRRAGERKRRREQGRR